MVAPKTQLEQQSWAKWYTIRTGAQLTPFTMEWQITRNDFGYDGSEVCGVLLRGSDVDDGEHDRKFHTYPEFIERMKQQLPALDHEAIQINWLHGRQGDNCHGEM